MGFFFNNSDINNIYVGNRKASSIYIGENQIWPVGLLVGTTFDFNYTGTVQSIDLPKGRYKLQAWGAQGGNVTGSYSANGSKGGYSEGILKLDEPKTLYVFVGGQGTSYSSDPTATTTPLNGGWNGGGCGVRYSEYDTSNEFGCSYPRPGGGATDFALVTSDMSYSSGRTNRSADSLNSRILVAGGGAGASAYYQEIGEYLENMELIESFEIKMVSTHSSRGPYGAVKLTNLSPNTTYRWVDFTGTSVLFESYNSSGTHIGGVYTTEFTTSSSFSSAWIYFYDKNAEIGDVVTGSLYQVSYESNGVDSDYGTSTTSKQGGGTSGKGQYPGTQSSAGTNGAFGLGANQTNTNYMYCGGGGGGGWYGGGTSRADSNVSYINYCGGGSGFVNISSNAQYRPSGYTGLELESGQTIAGDTSFPSTPGGTETGHSGDGFARITVVDENGEGGSGGGNVGPFTQWTIQTGSWTSTNNSNAYDGLMWESNMHTDSGSTVIRCTFSGLTSITFAFTQDSELNYDYLTAGKLDTPCTRSSYQFSMKGKNSGTYTYTCDTGEHYVEFCYSKDGSDSIGEDCAAITILDIL